ncbi:MAG: glycerate kinase [bacterium]|nr:glycerate kinase [bacterium]
MHIVIAPDSFKECATAKTVANAIAAGVARAVPEAKLTIKPMADGGEGTVDALVAATDGSLVGLSVTGPLGEPVHANYGILGDKTTAVIEMAAASGLALVPPDRRDPRVATTRGTGELMADALDRGVQRIIVGIGGSATNDGGAGMAQALGFSLRDDHLNEVGPGGAALVDLTRIDAGGRHSQLDECELVVACDVVNPLCGPDGASHVYGPQKGATPEMAVELDAALVHFAKVVEDKLDVTIADIPGAGAAGGLGAGLVAFAGGSLVPGVEVVAEACGLETAIRHADLVITGEGVLDAQSVNGKTPVGVAEIAQRHGVPVVAIVGALGSGGHELTAHIIDAAFSICPKPMSLEEAIAAAPELLASTAESVMRLWCAARRG